ncbi:MAG: DNA repair ATPase [Phycisphaeraceae bacterium]
MAETDSNTTAPQSAAPPSAPLDIDQGAYQVLRDRLLASGRELRERVNKLNAQRIDVFGGIPTQLLTTEQITTSHNCVPRDMAAFGDRFVFGYNVRFGLKQEIDLPDVFACARFDGQRFHEEPITFIADVVFRKEFQDLYRFYKHALFTKFFSHGPHLYMKFRVGRNMDDFKAFKWAISPDKLTYIDNRSDHEVRYPQQHSFDWNRVTRDMLRPGKNPHYAIDDCLFVETTGGDLTIKIEDNTEHGRGIYSEPVDDPSQSPDDAEISYALHGNLVLLRIRPFGEDGHRHFIFNRKLREVIRQDFIADACQALPDDHGLIFAGGYYLASGRHHVFPNMPARLTFEKRIASPNGEDYLYVMYDRGEGLYVLMPYNVIEQRVDTPIVCSGYSIFDNGRLVFFKAHEEPQRHHALQIWQTPFVAADFPVERKSDSRLYQIGNRDIVRGMAECTRLLQLIEREQLYAELYLDIVKAASAMLDGYHWLNEPASFQLAQVITQIRDTGQAAVSEYEKVVRLRKASQDALAQEQERTRNLISENAARLYNGVDAFVKSLALLREARGRIIGLKDVRYIDASQVEELEGQITEQTGELSRRAVEFLLKPDSLAPYASRGEQFAQMIGAVERVVEAKALSEKIETAAGELEMLIEIVSNLRIEDATQRTTIVDSISAVFATLNASRQALRNRIAELGRAEGAAEFNSQLRLLAQSVSNYLDLCDTPEKVDNYLTKMMVQLEELEGRFAEFDDLVVQLAQTRNEVVTAFEQRKLQITERRNRRAIALAQAADRILAGIKSRVDAMDSIQQIHGYFASDLMIDKVRDILEELASIQDTVRADDIQSRLKSIREDAVRQLKDRQDLQAEGPNTIRFGRHVFSVNTQPIELTLVRRDAGMQLHINGTRFFDPVEDAGLLDTREAWDQELVSERDEVYRAEYLAYKMLPWVTNLPENERRELLDESSLALLQRVQQFMATRYAEGYTKGVHDADATVLLRQLIDLSATIGLLRYSPAARTLGVLFWQMNEDTDLRRKLAGQLLAVREVFTSFPTQGKHPRSIEELEAAVRAFAAERPPLDPDLAHQAAEYLFMEGTIRAEGFASSPEADDLMRGFNDHLRNTAAARRFKDSLDKVGDDPWRRYLLHRDWMQAFFMASDLDRGRLASYLDEAALRLFEGPNSHARLVPVSTRRRIEGLRGGHKRIDNGAMDLEYTEFMTRLQRFERLAVPRFERFTQAKRKVVEAARHDIRVEEFKPRVLTSFVRNRLIDRVYLPLIGDNLAKQIGVSGNTTRTDRMGLLLVISPPGYGKTTLMEYIASRLGIVFVKINGPALGHGVTSLDPEEAPNAGAREEIERLNLAFEMGDNVMIYVDDIQHTNSEFLQKFISLCDAQRRVEGVFRGRTRTHDLRGRKVAVVMAGNPYTESGEKFRIPDMLANRADTYNLGDIIGEHGDSFRSSYLENALTSNPAINDLAARPANDVHAVIQIAATGSREGVDFESSFTSDQVDEMVNVMKKLIQVRDVVLRVNQQYIRSAAMEDRYRTEPAFLLQGSYRNMNRIAERVLPVMNDAELRTLILSAYEQDAQTLTTGAEANLLKFKEMMGWLDETEAKRWDDICRTFRRTNEVAMMGGDQAAAVVSQLSRFNEGLGDIGKAIAVAAASGGRHNGDAKAVLAIDEQTAGVIAALASRMDAMAQAMADSAAAAARQEDVPPAPPSPEQITGKTSPYEIKVINRVPEAFLVIIRQQFELMKSWLEPLGRIAAGQEDRIRQVVDSLETLTAKYERVIERLEKGRE